MIRFFRNTILGALVALAPGVAGALTVSDFNTNYSNFDFSVVGSGNSQAGDLAALNFGMSMTTDGSTVTLVFSNASPISSVIAQIYFDDSDLELMDSGVVLSPQVNNELYFMIGGGAPANLPGGGTISFSANTTLNAYAKSPSPKNGIGPSESLTLRYNLLTDITSFSDALQNNSLRIGMHVQSIGTLGQSDAFTFSPPQFPPNNPDPQAPIPEPATMILLGMGTSFLALRKRFAC